MADIKPEDRKRPRDDDVDSRFEALHMELAGERLARLVLEERVTKLETLLLTTPAAPAAAAASPAETRALEDEEDAAEQDRKAAHGVDIDTSIDVDVDPGDPDSTNLTIHVESKLVRITHRPPPSRPRANKAAMPPVIAARRPSPIVRPPRRSAAARKTLPLRAGVRPSGPWD